MKRSDFAVVGVIYAVAIFFYLQTRQLPDAAQTYPMGLIIALAVLNTLYMLRQLWTGWREGIIHNDFPVVFKHFQVSQFSVLVVLGVGYMVAMPYLGYYVASALFLVASLAFLRVRWWQTLLTVGVLFAMIYGIFTLFLSVPLPVGSLFE